MPDGFTNSIPTEPPGRFPWRVFWLLLVASLAGAAAVIPLALEVFQPMVRDAPRPNIPLPLLILVGVVQNLALLAVAIGLGLLLAGKIGLGAPLLESWLYRKAIPATARDSVKSGAMVGTAVGVVVLAGLLIAAPHFPGLPFVTASRVALWKRFLAGFYGGIDEEIIARLFLLSLLSWLGVKFFQKRERTLSRSTFWCANTIVAILFGLGHLPAASLVMPITPVVVLLALLLNGIAAMAFGYLYWKRGLESAMIAHFCADFVVYVVGVAFLR
jgi:hypothetical protein